MHLQDSILPYLCRTFASGPWHGGVIVFLVDLPPADFQPYSIAIAEKWPQRMALDRDPWFSKT